MATDGNVPPVYDEQTFSKTLSFAKNIPGMTPGASVTFQTLSPTIIAQSMQYQDPGGQVYDTLAYANSLLVTAHTGTGGVLDTIA